MENINLNLEGIFLMILKENLDNLIKLTSIMPEEIFNQLKQTMFLNLEPNLCDGLKIKIFEYLPNKEFNIIETYNTNDLLKIIEP